MDDDFKDWIGREHETRDVITPAKAEQFHSVFATSDASVMQGSLLGIQWCLAPFAVPMDQLGPDGHPAKGLFLPPVPLPRRMWAGGECHFMAPFQTGEVVNRRSTISDVTFKQGKSGPLCFVAVTHAYEVDGKSVMHERQDLVYREAASGPASLPKADQAEGCTANSMLRVDATPTLLFRYSALTFNGHRIHYDRDYAVNTEFYDGLVVHGPLQATYALRLAAASRGAPPSRFSYRGLSPLTDGKPFTVEAGPDENIMTVVVRAEDGRTTFRCEAAWEGS